MLQEDAICPPQREEQVDYAVSTSDFSAVQCYPESLVILDVSGISDWHPMVPTVPT